MGRFSLTNRHLAIASVLIGAALVVYGVSLVYTPAAVVIAGVSLVAFGFLAVDV